MKAAVVESAGKLVVRELPEPVMGEYQAKCQMLYGSVCAGTDTHLVNSHPPFSSWVKLPFILGHESVGRVVEVGAKVRNLKPGDVVTRVGTPGVDGVEIGWGGFAEVGIATDWRAMQEDGVEGWQRSTVNQILPPDIDPAVGALFITWRETLSYITRMGVVPNASLLVIGSGGNGLAFVSHARNLGATKVTMLGAANRKADAKLAGATAYFDYRSGSWLEQAMAEVADGYDFVIDAVGKADMVTKGQECLKTGGTIGIYGLDEHGKIQLTPGRTFTCYGGGYDEAETHEAVLKFYRAGKLNPSVWLDLKQTFALADIGRAFIALQNQTLVKPLIRLMPGPLDLKSNEALIPAQKTPVLAEADVPECGGGMSVDTRQGDQSNADTRWRGMKFGLMMHWGIYSVAGGVWQGENIPGYNEQIKHRAKISWPDYLTLLDGFSAGKWDPDAVVRLAGEAGMKYVAITTKHHDGFNLWHTKLSDFNAADATPARRDVLKALSDACQVHGMNFGIYYSLIDWHYPGAAPMSDTNSDPITPALEHYTVGQLRELLTGYGPLCEIWFDMGMPTPEQSRRFADLAHQLQPDCRVSGRIWNGCDDFMECGDNETPDFWFDGPWESSVTMFHDTWGYRSWQEHGSVEAKIREKIRDVAFVTARGGNYLLNIGPRGDGSIVEFDAEVLKGIGRWMDVHGEAVFNGEPQPHLPLDFGYATGRPGRLYLYVATPPADGILRVPGWRTQPVSACLLARSATLPLACARVGDALEIRLPESGLDTNLPVIVLDYTGTQPYLPQDAIIIRGSETVELAPASSLAWHRMLGQDYYSLKKFVVAREWLLWPEITVTGRLIARRPAGGSVAGFRLSVDGRDKQFIFAESGEAQAHEYHELSLSSGVMATVKLHHITPRHELEDEGLVLEFRPST